MPESLKSAPESSTPSAKRALPRPLHPPGTVLPNGKTVIESHAAYAPLPLDPKTGKPIPPARPRIK